MERSLGNLILKTKGTENNSDIGNKLEDFEILQIIGKGTYGFVAKVKSKLNLRIYALKKYNSEYLNKPDALKYVVNESIFMKQLNNENVVKLYNNFKDKSGLYGYGIYGWRRFIYFFKCLYEFEFKNRRRKIMEYIWAMLKGISLFTSERIDTQRYKTS